MIKFVFYIYRLFFTPRMGACRYVPTCSQYTQDAIEKYGLIKGIIMGLKRIASCHPLSKKDIFDPIPNESI